MVLRSAYSSDPHNVAWGRAAVWDCDLCEARRAAEASALHEYVEHFILLRLQMRIEPAGRLLPQPCGALFHQRTAKLRHARGRRLRPGREGKDMQKAQAAFIRKPERIRKHGLVLGREARNQI